MAVQSNVDYEKSKILFIDLVQECQVNSQNGSDWHQLGQIRDFFRSDFSTFWLAGPKFTEILLTNSVFVSFGDNLIKPDLISLNYIYF